MPIAKPLPRLATMLRPEDDSDAVPEAPEPDAADGAGGLAEAQELASRYMTQNVRLLASVAHGKSKRVKLHSRVVAAVQLIKIANGIGSEAVPEVDPDEG
jgi:hypothetical protein